MSAIRSGSGDGGDGGRVVFVVELEPYVVSQPSRLSPLSLSVSSVAGLLHRTKVSFSDYLSENLIEKLYVVEDEPM